MCYDYLSIIYANDCARSVRLANRRRSALFRTRGSSVLPSVLLCSAQRLALFCSAACSVLYDAAQQHQTLPCLFLAFLAFSCLPRLSLLPYSSFLLPFSPSFFLFFSFLLKVFAHFCCCLFFLPYLCKNRRNNVCLWTKRR